MLIMQKNRFFGIINEHELDANLFSIEEEEVDGVIHYTIRLLDAPLKFMIEISERDYNLVDYSRSLLAPKFPMSGYTFDYDGNRSWYKIESVFNSFSDWLSEVVAVYLEDECTPDLWEQLKEQEEFFESGDASADEYTFYSQEEQKRLGVGIETFKEVLEEQFSPAKEELDKINKRLDYLSEEVSKLNKFNWKSVAFSTLVKIATKLSLDSDQFKELIELFKKSCGVVLQLPGN